ncbi:hypothetical protein F442_07710 [Phytophthora nicotianae P10297]|uniref:DDE Tnp4 domain-containing protein n=1 Tax=Phytophthora nicotianae P10297 TaxID=1317064 RepID=W2ZF52_PHYNI|nr:hypothetical protein F442_07710 [Phytophthora nicotianae P10297]
MRLLSIQGWAITNTQLTRFGLEDYAKQLAFLPDFTEDSSTIIDYGVPNVKNLCLTTDQQERLVATLKKSERILIASGNTLPPHGVVCDIDTQGHAPIKQRARRVSLCYLGKLYKLLRALLKAGLIVFSDSPWASPIVLVMKKNALDIRLFIDYKIVNVITGIMEYAMALVDALLTNLEIYLWFCSLDAASGFGAITMTLRARKVSTFAGGSRTGTELQDYFGRSGSGISNIFLHTLNFLDVKYKKLLAFGGHIAATRLCVYENAIFEVGSPYTNIWSFIDGTVRGICRPQPRQNGTGKMLMQQSVYNGHKRKHGLKFQTLVTPDGLIIHLFGQFPGRNHDIKMFAKSGLADQVRSDSRFVDYRIFGDCAYGRDDVMLSPFEGAVGNLTEAQKDINSKMSKVRVSVEWSYAQVVNYWKTLDVKSNLRVGTQPVGQMYRVGILMTNCITCIRGENTASDYFSVKPPDNREYLRTNRN